MPSQRFARNFALGIVAWCAAAGAQPPAGGGDVPPAPVDAAPRPAEAPIHRPVDPPVDDEPWFVAHDCQLCHQVDVRTIGPAYTDIAGRYAATQGTATEDTIAELAAHVVEGSQGHWGDTPMTAHPELGVEQAREMVKRILALAKH